MYKDFNKQTVEISLSELKAINTLLVGGEPNPQLNIVLNDILGNIKDVNEVIKEKFTLSVGLLLKGLRKLDTATRYKKCGDQWYGYQYQSHSFLMNIVNVRRYKVNVDLHTGEIKGNPESGYTESFEIDTFESMDKTLKDDPNTQNNYALAE